MDEAHPQSDIWYDDPDAAELPEPYKSIGMLDRHLYCEVIAVVSWFDPQSNCVWWVGFVVVGQRGL
jgi:hypothetical protein